MTPAVAAQQAGSRRFQIDSRFVAPILITCILLVGELSYRILESYPKTILAIVSSIATEILLGLLITRRIPHLASAYVSGISCGILLRSPEWWPFALAGILATASKYVIRVQGRHLWNPSNLAIVLMILFAHNSISTLGIQWGNDVRVNLLIWGLGSVIIYRLKRFHICLTYVASFIAFAALRTGLNIDHDMRPFSNRFFSEIAPITGPMYQLFIFFMITDPKTTTQSRNIQMLVAFLIAATECALRLSAPLLIRIHAPYFALTIMGPLSNLIEIYQKGRLQKAAPAVSV